MEKLKIASITGFYLDSKILEADVGSYCARAGVDFEFHIFGSGKQLLEKISKDDFDEAEDGVKAWELLEQNQYDIVLTDWNMPNMNGLQLVKKIRSEGNHQGIPIIMITTEGGKSEVITALKAGVNNYIVKPFTPQVLKEKLAAVMGIEV